ncbi:MAG: hypothetical protein AVDCRST_MAG96-2499 [uncultured Segetibacter sp.]|uniref:Uncharacterized protein n=1 Tax=uncultured Segetibacter sp. TaxID=481133 RepID=A0A6J4T342_9BACT|nr:MAG: hypothetical protein AVDCRST_MAG96-2499 [uncultured Segetibacter sp.]
MVFNERTRYTYLALRAPPFLNSRGGSVTGSPELPWKEQGGTI